jgi:hypothetical protein
MHLSYAAFFLVTVAACGAVEPEPALCPAAPPTCITPSVACGAPGTADPVCADRTWSCPEGTREYVRAKSEATSCLPFSGSGTPFTSLGGSLARIPVDGGRCLWVAETATTTAGDSLRNVGLMPEDDAAFGSCPMTSTFAGGAPLPVVEVEGDSDPEILVQIDGGFVDGGATKVLYRLFHTDPNAVFGVTLLGSGFGRWDATTQRIVVPGPKGLLWDPSIDPGDASLVVDGTPYVWGCHAPAQFLSNPCAVGRVTGGELAFLTSSDAWLTDADVAETATVFTAGPWISSVVHSAAGGLLHVYAEGFGTTLETHTATSVTGPWAPGPSLGACDLPSDDPHALCAGPVVHEELMDPTHPGELVVSYGVGTTGTQPPTPDGKPAPQGTLSTSYWTRLTWTTLPAE